MATIRFNQIADARGSINGTVYSRGIGGLYMKNRVKPINPQTAKQIAVRSRLSLLASGWRGLTDAQRGAWKAQAENYPATNRVGESYVPSGYQLYMTLNSNLGTVGDTAIDSPLAPESFAANAVSSFTVELTAGVITTGVLSLDNTSSASEKGIIEMTAPLSPGVSAPSQSLFKNVQVTAASFDEFDFAAAYVAVFGQPPVGAKIFASAYFVNTSTGQKTLVGKISTVVTTV